MKIYRAKLGRSLMPKAKVPFYNSIDMGIFIYFLELALSYNKITFSRYLFNRNTEDELNLVAEYSLNLGYY